MSAQTAQYFTVGAMVVAIYDYCLTTAPEVQLIWGWRWTVIRVTFTLARYVPFIGVAMTTYGLLIFRAYAFWQQSKQVLIWPLILAAICIAGSGLVYMACIIMASVANIFVSLLAPASYIAIMHAPQLVIHGVLASRILFNLRQSHETDSEIIGGMFPLAHASRLPSGAMRPDPNKIDEADATREFIARKLTRKSLRLVGTVKTEPRDASMDEELHAQF
ncbi:hypothetical protein M405DRAFT_937476 [Rhizopogon salebrosus TDB-379]|nr:hypothetical protein M405DRAFT_937476 [Rhizopogon salebrosus TDB-379]